MLENFKAYYYRALCNEKLGNIREEEQDYLSALEINSSNINTIYHLGLFYERQENYKEAL